MEIVKRAALATKAERGEGSMGLYDRFVCNEQILDALLALETDEAAVVNITEFSSNANSSTGCVYGLNKVFVAGCIPLKAKTSGKNKVAIVATHGFDEENYATDVSILNKASNTAYEQPSPGQITRVRSWLKKHGYASDESGLPQNDEEDMDQSEENEEVETSVKDFERIDSDTFNNM